MPPTAAPIKPPFTLFPLVAAPITAPAAAPMAASRCVCFTTTSLPDDTVPPLLVTVRVPPLLVRRRVVVVVRGVVVAGPVVNALPRSAADNVSCPGPCCWAASDRSVLSAVSAALFGPRLQLAVMTSAASVSVDHLENIGYLPAWVRTKRGRGCAR